MTVEEIASILLLLAYANRKNREFFLAIENELYMREFDLIPVYLIGRMLKGFSYCNFGSSMMFSKIAKSINIA